MLVAEGFGELGPLAFPAKVVKVPEETGLSPNPLLANK